MVFVLMKRRSPIYFLVIIMNGAPGMHTLFFATRQTAEESGSTTNAWKISLVLMVTLNGIFDSIKTFNDTDVGISPTRNILRANCNRSGKLRITLPLSGRVMNGAMFSIRIWKPSALLPVFSSAFSIQICPSDENFELDFHRFDSLYGYHTWQIMDSFSITAGLSYDWLHMPADVATAPFSTREKTTVQFSPKIGFIYTPFHNSTVRAAYTRSLSGFADGQSDRIEPTEVAGFNQDFRSIIPESVAGDSSGSRIRHD